MGKEPLEKHLFNSNAEFEKDDKSEWFSGKFLPYLVVIKRSWLGKLVPSQKNLSKF